MSNMNCQGERPDGIKRKIGYLQVSGRNYDLFNGENTIGSDDSCTVVFKSKAVDKVHAVITVDDPSLPMLCDKGSKYKTRLGKNVVEPHRIYCFPENAKLMFGNVKAIYMKIPDSDEEEEDDDDDFFFTGSSQNVEEPKHEGTNHGSPSDTSAVPCINQVVIEESPTQLNPVMGGKAVTTLDKVKDNEAIICGDSPSKPSVNTSWVEETSSVLNQSVVEETLIEDSPSKPSTSEVKNLLSAQSKSVVEESPDKSRESSGLSEKAVVDDSPNASSVIHNVSMFEETIRILSDEEEENTDVFIQPKIIQEKPHVIHDYNEEISEAETQPLDSSFEFFDKSASYVGVPLKTGEESASNRKITLNNVASSSEKPCKYNFLKTEDNSQSKIVADCRLPQLLCKSLVDKDNLDKDVTETGSEDPCDSQLSFRLVLEGTQCFDDSDISDTRVVKSADNETKMKVSKNECHEDSMKSHEMPINGFENGISDARESNKDKNDITNQSTIDTTCQSNVTIDITEIISATLSPVQNNLSKTDCEPTRMDLTLNPAHSVDQNRDITSCKENLNEMILGKENCEIIRSDDSETDEDINLLSSQKNDNREVSDCKRHPINAYLKQHLYEFATNTSVEGSTREKQDDCVTNKEGTVLSPEKETNKKKYFCKRAPFDKSNVNLNVDKSKTVPTKESTPKFNESIGNEISENRSIVVNENPDSRNLTDHENNSLNEASFELHLDESMPITTVEEITATVDKPNGAHTDDELSLLSSQKEGKMIKPADQASVEKSNHNVIESRPVAGEDTVTGLVESDGGETDEDISLLSPGRENFRKVAVCEKYPVDLKHNLGERTRNNIDKENISTFEEKGVCETDDEISLLSSEREVNEKKLVSGQASIDESNIKLGSTESKTITGKQNETKPYESSDSETDEDINLLATVPICRKKVAVFKSNPVNEESMRNTSVEGNIFSLKNQHDSQADKKVSFLYSGRQATKKKPRNYQSPVDELNDMPCKISPATENRLDDSSETDEDLNLRTTQKNSIKMVAICKRQPVNVKLNFNETGKNTGFKKHVIDEQNYSDTDEEIGLSIGRGIDNHQNATCNQAAIDDPNIKLNSIDSKSELVKGNVTNLDESDGSETDEDISLLATQKHSTRRFAVCKRQPVKVSNLKLNLYQNVKNMTVNDDVSVHNQTCESKINTSSETVLSKEIIPKLDESDGSETDEDISLLASQNSNIREVNVCMRQSINEVGKRLNSGDCVIDNSADENVCTLEKHNNSKTDEGSLLSSQTNRSKSNCNLAHEDDIEFKCTSDEVNATKPDLSSGSETDEDMSLLGAEKNFVKKVAICKRQPVKEVNICLEKSARDLSVKENASVSEKRDESETDEDINLPTAQKNVCKTLAICKRKPVNEFNLRSRMEDAGNVLVEENKSIIEKEDSGTYEDTNLLAFQKIDSKKVAVCKRQPIDKVNFKESLEEHPKNFSVEKTVPVLEIQDDSETDEDINLLATQKIRSRKVTVSKRQPINKINLKESLEEHPKNLSVEETVPVLEKQDDSETDEDINLLATQKIRSRKVDVCKRQPINKVHLKESLEEHPKNLSVEETVPVLEIQDDSETDEDINLLATQKIRSTKVTICKRQPTNKVNLKESLEEPTENLSVEKTVPILEKQDDSETDEDINLLASQKIDSKKVAVSKRQPINKVNLKESLEEHPKNLSVEKTVPILEKKDDSETDEDINLLATQKIRSKKVAVSKRQPINKVNLKESLEEPTKNLSVEETVPVLEKQDDSETDEDINLLATQKIRSRKVTVCKRQPIDKVNFKESLEEPTKNLSVEKTVPILEKKDDSETDEDINLLASQKIDSKKVAVSKRQPINKVNLKESLEEPTKNLSVEETVPVLEIQDDSETDEDINLLATQKIRSRKVDVCKRQPINKVHLKESLEEHPKNLSVEETVPVLEIQDDSETDEDINLLATQKIRSRKVTVCKRQPINKVNLKESLEEPTENLSVEKTVPILEKQDDSETDEDINLLATQKIRSRKVTVCKRQPINKVNLKESLEEPTENLSVEKTVPILEKQDDSKTDEDINLLATQKIRSRKVTVCKRQPINKVNLKESLEEPTENLSVEKTVPILEKQDDSETDEDINLLATQKIRSRKVTVCKRQPINKVNLKESLEEPTKNLSVEETVPILEKKDDSETDEDINLLATQKIRSRKVDVCKRQPISKVHLKESLEEDPKNLSVEEAVPVLEKQDDSETDEDINLLATQKIRSRKVAVCKRQPINKVNLKESLEESAKNLSVGETVPILIEPDDSETDEDINLLATQKIGYKKVALCKRQPVTKINVKKNLEESTKDLSIEENVPNLEEQDDSGTDEDTNLLATQKNNSRKVAVSKRQPVYKVNLKRSLKESASNLLVKESVSILRKQDDSETDEDVNLITTNKNVRKRVAFCKRQPLKINLKGNSEESTRNLLIKDDVLIRDKREDSETDEDISLLATQKNEGREVAICKRLPVNEANLKVCVGEFSIKSSDFVSQNSKVSAVDSDADPILVAQNNIIEKLFNDQPLDGTHVELRLDASDIVPSSVIERTNKNKFDGEKRRKERTDEENSLMDTLIISDSPNLCLEKDERNSSQSMGKIRELNFSDNKSDKKDSVCSSRKFSFEDTVISNRLPVCESNMKADLITADVASTSLPQNNSKSKKICNRNFNNETESLNEAQKNNNKNESFSREKENKSGRSRLTKKVTVEKSKKKSKYSTRLQKLDEKNNCNNPFTIAGTSNKIKNTTMISNMCESKVTELSSDVKEIDKKNVTENDKLQQLNYENNDDISDLETQKCVDFDSAFGIIDIRSLNEDINSDVSNINCPLRESIESQGSEENYLSPSVKLPVLDTQAETSPIVAPFYDSNDIKEGIVITGGPDTVCPSSQTSNFSTKIDIEYCSDLKPSIKSESEDMSADVLTGKSMAESISGSSVERPAETSEGELSDTISQCKKSFQLVDEEEIENDRKLTEMSTRIENENPLFNLTIGRSKRKRYPTQKVKDMFNLHSRKSGLSEEVLSEKNKSLKTYPMTRICDEKSCMKQIKNFVKKKDDKIPPENNANLFVNNTNVESEKKSKVHATRDDKHSSELSLEKSNECYDASRKSTVDVQRKSDQSSVTCSAVSKNVKTLGSSCNKYLDEDSDDKLKSLFKKRKLSQSEKEENATASLKDNKDEICVLSVEQNHLQIKNTVSAREQNQMSTDLTTSIATRGSKNYKSITEKKAKNELSVTVDSEVQGTSTVVENSMYLEESRKCTRSLRNKFLGGKLQSEESSKLSDQGSINVKGKGKFCSLDHYGQNLPSSTVTSVCELSCSPQKIPEKTVPSCNREKSDFCKKLNSKTEIHQMVNSVDGQSGLSDRSMRARKRKISSEIPFGQVLVDDKCHDDISKKPNSKKLCLTKSSEDQSAFSNVDEHKKLNKIVETIPVENDNGRSSRSKKKNNFSKQERNSSKTVATDSNDVSSNIVTKSVFERSTRSNRLASKVDKVLKDIHEESSNSTPVIKDKVLRSSDVKIVPDDTTPKNIAKISSRVKNNIVGRERIQRNKKSTLNLTSSDSDCLGNSSKAEKVLPFYDSSMSLENSKENSDVLRSHDITSRGRKRKLKSCTTNINDFEDKNELKSKNINYVPASNRKLKMALRVSHEKAVEDEEITSSFSAVTPTRSSSSSIQSPSSSSRVRRKVCLKEKILFTYLSDQKYTSVIAKLGGQVTDTPNDCTVLVTDKVRRTVKFLCVVSMGKPIVSLKWITDSNKAGCFLDPWRYIICDKEAEKKFKFKLEESLKEAQIKPMLDEGTNFYVTPSVKPPADEMRSIIKSVGGTFCDKEPSKWSPSTFIISCEEDKSLWTKLKKKKLNILIVSTEAILTGILQQSFSPEDYVIGP